MIGRIRTVDASFQFYGQLLQVDFSKNQVFLSKAGNLYCRGYLCTVDLLVKIGRFLRK
jgi:hypothetical protein